MTNTEQKAILTIAMMAAFADGENSEAERKALRDMAESFGPESGINLWEIYQEVLNQRRSLSEVAADLSSPEARSMAYEMAAGVCGSCGVMNDQERSFLETLRGELKLSSTASSAEPPKQEEAGAAPKLEPVDTGAIDKMIINYSILNSALELLPEGLSNMAIMPLQMRMVYRVGKHYGYTLDRGHIRDLLATAGVGFAAQAVEGMARRLLGGLAGQFLGGLGRSLVGTGTSAAVTFAGTYAIGQLANRYYAGGRVMNAAVLRDTYARLLSEGRSLFTQHASEVQSRASTINPADVINLVRTG